MFTDKNGNNVIDITGTASTNDILQENHYYGFGLGFEGPWLMDDAGRDNPYQYNEKELNEDFGLDWYDYGARWYNAAIGRFGAIDRFAEKYYPITSYHYAANNPVKFVDMNGDSLRLNFIGQYAQHTQNKLSGIINNALEGQFRVIYQDAEYDEDNEVASGLAVLVPTEGGGDLSKMTLHGQEFYREFIDIAHEEGTLTEVNIDYARSDIHTGNFNKETIDVADVLKFNENLSELGGTQGGKVIHEIREQYSKQVLGETIFSTAHRQAIQSENNVNLSVRKDSGGGRTAIQSYSARGNTVRNEIIYNNRRVIKVKKQ